MVFQATILQCKVSYTAHNREAECLLTKERGEIDRQRGERDLKFHVSHNRQVVCLLTAKFTLALTTKRGERQRQREREIERDGITTIAPSFLVDALTDFTSCSGEPHDTRFAGEIVDIVRAVSAIHTRVAITFVDFWKQQNSV